MTDAPFPAPGDAALDEDPPPWDGAAPTLRGPYEGWANWPMPNPPSLGLPNPQSYDTSTPGVVRDNVTGLEWQAQSFDDGQNGILSWGQAVAYCQGLTLAGQSDWRVPSRIELVSLYDSTRVSPAFNAAFLQPAAYSPGVEESDWTSTLAVGNPSTAWTGALYWENLGTITDTMATAYTRCVRGGPATDVLPPDRYLVAAGTVYDTMTRLTWQRADSGGQLDWSDASTYCASIDLDLDAAAGAWRLPTMNELETLVDETVHWWNTAATTAPTAINGIPMSAFAPMIDSATFPNTYQGPYWTVDVLADGYRGSVSFFWGQAEQYQDTASYPATGTAVVRCVR